MSPNFLQRPPVKIISNPRPYRTGLEIIHLGRFFSIAFGKLDRSCSKHRDIEPGWNSAFKIMGSNHEAEPSLPTEFDAARHSRRPCSILPTRLLRRNSFLAPGWKQFSHPVGNYSHSAGICFGPGWKTRIAPGCKDPRTRLEGTSHPVGKKACVTDYVSNICAKPCGFTDLHSFVPL